MSARTEDEYRVSIDFITCRGHGMCAYLLPDNFELDEWGYPIVKDDKLSRREVRQAKRAVRLCPELAMKIEKTKKKVEAARR